MKLHSMSCLILCSFIATGCLKTRSQLREETDARADQVDYSYSQPGQPVPMDPVEVKESHYAIDEIKAVFARLTGRIEDLERANSARANNDVHSSIETRLAEVEKKQALLLDSLTKVKSASGYEDTDAFDKGKMAFEEGNHEEAIRLMTQYLANAKAKRASEATFIRAESYFASKDFKNAIVDYSKFPERFPKSKLMPQALFKIGLSFQNLGRKDDGKAFFQELVEKYPKSEEAKKARAYLK